MESEEIQNKAVQLYLKNMSFFESNYKEVYKKIKLFEEAIEKELYSESWELEYKDSEYFDIYNNKTETYLYKENSVIFSEAKKDSVDLSSKNTFNALYKFKKIGDLKLSKNISDSILDYYFYLSNIMNKDITTVKEQRLKKIDKYVFIGTGLGLHIPKISEKINAKVYLIIEPNIEIFRLSLFLTDYTTILKEFKPNRLFFSISENNEEFNKTFSNFYKNYIYYNYVLKFDLFLDGYKNILEQISSILYTKNPFEFPFSTYLLSLKRNISFIKDNYNFLKFNEPILKNKRVIILGAGPSLEKNISWLKENQSSLIIVAIAATLKKLEKYDIVPDIITSLDPYKEVVSQFQVDEKYYKNSIFMCTSNTMPEVIELFPKENVYIFLVLSQIGIENIPFLTGTTISEVTYALCLYMDVNEIYLLGIDAALDQETGSTHIQEHEFVKKFEKLEKKDILKDKRILSDDLIEVEGNFRDKVLTTRAFNQIIRNFEKFSSLAIGKKVFNLSDGARLKLVEPLGVKDISLDSKLEKRLLLEEIIKKLNSYSVNELTKVFKVSLKNDLNTVKEMLKSIRFYKKKKLKDYDSMQLERIDLMIKIEESYKGVENLIIVDILKSLMQGSNLMIFNHFETSNKARKNIKNMNSIYQVWLSILEKTVIELKDILERI